MTRSHSAPHWILWLLAFAAITSHLPAVGFDFAQDDFANLARALGDASATPSGARTWTTSFTWSALWPLFGSDPAPYHGLSLLLLAGVVVFAARLAGRLGAGTMGALAAGLLVLWGPTTALPIAWVSASNELWAALFALAALDRTAVAGSGRDAFLGAVLAILSVHSKEAALAIGPALWWIGRTFAADEDEALRRARLLLSVVVTLASLHAGWRAFDALTAVDGGAYGVAGAGSIAVHLLRVVGWAAWPINGGILAAGPTAGLGAAVLVAGLLYAVQRARHGDRVPAGLAIALVATALPAAANARGPEPYHALLPSVVLAVGIARALSPVLGDRPVGSRSRVAVALLATVAVAVVAAAGIDARVHARGANGQLVHPVLRHTTVAHTVRTQIESLHAARPQPIAIGLLQASRAESEPVQLRPDRFFLASPVHAALDGDRGLAVLSHGGPQAKWVTHVDDVPEGGFVFLDPGDAFLRPLGPPANARLYTALIAVSAGQFQRARHDLWNVLAEQGVNVQFAFDPMHLPIRPEELDAEAEAFARFLVDTAGNDGTSTNVRILRLFEQIFETVRGKELLRDLEDLEALRAPRRAG